MLPDRLVVVMPKPEFSAVQRDSSFLIPEMRKPPTVRWGVFKKIRRRPTLPGGDLQVPSALVGLTAVFEMGTGVTPPPKPPETYAYVTLVTGSLILKRFIASTNIYNSKPSAD